MDRNTKIIVRTVKSLLNFRMLDIENDITDYHILYAFMGPDTGYDNTNIYNDDIESEIRTTVPFSGRPGVFSQLGDAVYEVLLTDYLYKYVPHPRIRQLGEGKSNRSMVCIMKESSIRKYLSFFITDTGGKVVADAFETLLGMAYYYGVKKYDFVDDYDRSFTDIYMKWLDVTFYVPHYFELLVSMEDPCGNMIEPDTGVNIYNALITAYQKLLVIFSNILHGDSEKVTPLSVHVNFFEYYTHISPVLKKHISTHILDSDDILYSVYTVLRYIIISPVDNKTFARNPSVPVEKRFKA
jgi:hypothetical protein